MSETMIERVARAIAEDMGADKWQDYIPTARVAIDAMREPTQTMIGSARQQGIMRKLVWHRMIDAALNE